MAKFRRDKPHAVIFGHFHGASFEQFGRYFDQEGNDVSDKIAVADPSYAPPLPKPENVQLSETSPDVQRLSALMESGRSFDEAVNLILKERGPTVVKIGAPDPEPAPTPEPAPAASQPPKPADPAAHNPAAEVSEAVIANWNWNRLSSEYRRLFSEWPKNKDEALTRVRGHYGLAA